MYLGDHLHTHTIIQVPLSGLDNYFCEHRGFKQKFAAIDESHRLDDNEKMTLTLNKGHSGMRGGAQSLNIVNEPELYSLTLGSKKPEAEMFKWEYPFPCHGELMLPLSYHDIYLVVQQSILSQYDAPMNEVRTITSLGGNQIVAAAYPPKAI